MMITSFAVHNIYAGSSEARPVIAPDKARCAATPIACIIGDRTVQAGGMT
jgi:hypothetical protein